MKHSEAFLWVAALTTLLVVGAIGWETAPLVARPSHQGTAMPSNDKSLRPQPQPTESEAIVAAQRAAQSPGTRLVPPVPLPVEQAAALPLPSSPKASQK